MAQVTKRRGERGAELIEFALVLPVLLLIIAGIFDFGFAFQSYEVVTNAAREGARIGVLPGYGPADVQGRVATYVAASGLTATPTTQVGAVTFPAAGNGLSDPAVQVTVTYPYTFLVLGPIAELVGGSFGAINLTAVATMRVEAPATGG